jgi:hypothetical protein
MTKKKQKQDTRIHSADRRLGHPEVMDITEQERQMIEILREWNKTKNYQLQIEIKPQVWGGRKLSDSRPLHWLGKLREGRCAS